MPKGMAGTCPEWLEEWPVREGERLSWSMIGTRLNISCRQVWG
jgi:alkylated DNA repair protein alkB homolog 1